MHCKIASCAVLTLMLAAPPVEAIARQETQPPEKQETPPKLSAEERREALAVADSFIELFRESRDLDPIIKKLFAKGFERFIGGDTSWAGLVGLSSPLVEHLNQADRARCYSLQFSIEYIIRLYVAGKVSFDSLKGDPAPAVFPPDVLKFFESNQPPQAEVTTNEESRRTLAIFERTLPYLREHLLDPAPEKTDQFKQNLVAFEKHLDDPDNNLGRPVLRTPEEEVAGYPVGTRLIAMEIPFHFGLLLVRENGALKILFAISRIPPD